MSDVYLSFSLQENLSHYPVCFARKSVALPSLFFNFHKKSLFLLYYSLYA